MTKKSSDAPSEPDHSNKRRVTLRDIAQELGVSHVTVSKALRNQSGASPELKTRIQEKAAEMGYIPDPMLSALSHYRKTSKEKPVQSGVAWINTWSEPEQLREHNEFNLYWEGAQFSAKRFGFHLEEFRQAEIPLKRLESILKARNIQGIILPPLRETVEELAHFDWSNFAVVRFGNAIPEPRTHFVTSAQMVNTMLAFDRISELGYKRIGCVCEYWRTRFFGVGYSWAQKTLPSEQQLPLLSLNQDDVYETQKSALALWMKEAKPDAVLTDNANVLRMLAELGYRIPEDLGLATTSVHDTPIDAGIDQSPFEIGRAAMRILTALIAERSFGLPESCNETLVEGNWVDGSMLPPRN